MNIPIARFLQLRDGESKPETEEEMLELVRFTFHSGSAEIAQVLSQRAKIVEIRSLEMETCRKILGIHEEFLNRPDVHGTAGST